MKLRLVALTLASTMLSVPAMADTVLNTDLPVLNGVTHTTTTDATGTRTNSTGARVSAPFQSYTWRQTSVGGGATVGITTDYARSGNGSVSFETTGNPAKADLTYSFAEAIPLSSFASIAYDFYRDGASTVGGNFAPVFRFEIFKNATFAGSLVLEHLYQNQTQPALDSWTTVSATQTSGIWWATNGLLGPTFADANGGQKSLQAWIDANAGSTLYVTGYNIGVGSGWTDGTQAGTGLFRGALDNIAITNDAGTQSFNFEVAGAVPEPASWAMLIGGFGVVGGTLRSRRRTTVAFA